MTKPDVTPAPVLAALDRVADAPAASFAPTGALYGSPEGHAALRDRVLTRTWHIVATRDQLDTPGDVLPVTLLPGCLDEPLLLVHGADGVIRCLSNVCTHRAAPLVAKPCRPAALRCPYHGRRFDLSGACTHAPELDATPGFPTAEDHLPRVAVGTWGPFVFVSLDPAMPLDDVLDPLGARLAHLPLAQAVRDPAGDRHFDVEAAWPLWCDNYLEGFHVPWVHPGLARSLDWRAYRTELTTWGVTQIGIASPDTPAFTLPEGHPDHGERIAGWYWWLFPLTTLNVYPWGISVNLLEPLGPTRTRIRYQSWVIDPALRDVGAGAGLDDVEREDDAIIERVQRGVRSRLYRGGRYSPAWEGGVHHFHRLTASLLKG